MLTPAEQHWLRLKPEDGYVTGEWPGYKGRPGETHLWRRVSETITTDVDQIGFLYGLVRLIKPALAVESGCNIGLTSYALGLALKENGVGKLVTCDVNDEHCVATRARCAELPVEVRNCPALELPELSQCDFLYSDSSNSSRIAEVERARPGCIVVVDDTLEPQLAEATRGRGISLPTPRGAMVIQKC